MCFQVAVCIVRNMVNKGSKYKYNNNDKIKSLQPCKCNWKGCGKIFSKRSNLKAHMRVHSEILPFPCFFPGCTKRFRWKSSFKPHVRMHLLCGDVFPFPTSIEQINNENNCNEQQEPSEDNEEIERFGTELFDIQNDQHDMMNSTSREDVCIEMNDDYNEKGIVMNESGILISDSVTQSGSFEMNATANSCLGMCGTSCERSSSNDEDEGMLIIPTPSSSSHSLLPSSSSQSLLPSSSPFDIKQGNNELWTGEDDSIVEDSLKDYYLERLFTDSSYCI